jgi:26S proteasome regulatory subunit N3
VYLQPYLAITRAVRYGDLMQFQSAMQANSAGFIGDNTASLLLRLRHNVIKAGLRKINLSYSRINLETIAAKLNLNEASNLDTEYMIAKAISDGVIEAKLSHNDKNSILVSDVEEDIYGNNNPQAAFNKRIVFSMKIYNEALKSLRFPYQQNKTISGNIESDSDEDEELAEKASKKAQEKEEKEAQKKKKE